MADTESYNSKARRQGSHVTPSPSKFHTHLLLKAAIAITFVVVFPFFPSQAPEFINQTVNARNWEILQLVFVAIAVSYGLLSKKSDEIDNWYSKYDSGYSSSFDNAQSYVNRLLRVSSVFDDETPNLSITDEKIQSWNSQYCKGEPVVAVTQEIFVPDEQRDLGNPNGRSPLFLPVRSLKSGFLDLDVNGSSDDSGFSNLLSEEKMEETSFLHSPVPWQSRSGRMVWKDNSKKSSAPTASQSLVLSNLHLQSSTIDSNSSVIDDDVIAERELKRSIKIVPKEFRENGEKPLSKARSGSGSGSKVKPTIQIDSTFMGKSVRTTRLGESVRRAEKTEKENVKDENSSKEDKKLTPNEFPKEGRKKKTVQKVIVETDEAMEADDENIERGDSGYTETESVNVCNGGADVNKKADEFIAKFREQIRLQKITSTRRSTDHQLAQKSV